LLDTQLLVFKTVAEQKSFSRAAQVLHMTQPAISIHVQTLEDYFGTRLLDRTNRRVSLTEAGRVLYHYAVQLSRLYDEARKAVAEVSGKVKGKLIIGATLTIGEYLLPRVAGYYKQKYPEVEITLQIANTQEIVRRVLAHELDLGVIEGQVEHPDLIQEDIFQDELVIIVSPRHPWAERGEITLEELKSEPIILREEGSGTRQVAAEGLKKVGVELWSLKVAMELGSTQAIKEAVEAGLGVAIISRLAIKKESRNNLLREVRLRGVDFKRMLRVAYSRHKFRSPAAEAFLDLLLSKEAFKVLD
jgi:DNA-binding transcriptional LysR family regulator